MKKVICKKCRFFYEPDAASWASEACTHPVCFMKNGFDPTTGKQRFTRLMDYNIKNQFLDCHSFEKKRFIDYINGSVVFMGIVIALVILFIEIG